MSLVTTFDISHGIRHSIYIGGKVDAKDYDKLVYRWKITHILNVTPPKEANIIAGVPNYFEKKRITLNQQQQRLKASSSSSSSSFSFVYERIPIYDSSTSVSQLHNYKDTIVNFITRGLCHGNVLIHCQHGISRSTTCVILYLLLYVYLIIVVLEMKIEKEREE